MCCLPRYAQAAGVEMKPFTTNIPVYGVAREQDLEPPPGAVDGNVVPAFRAADGVAAGQFVARFGPQAGRLSVRGREENSEDRQDSNELHFFELLRVKT